MKQKLILLFILFSIPLIAQDFQQNGIYYTSYTSSSPFVARVVASPVKYVGTINIPEKVSYNGIVYDVKHIDMAFYECPDLISVTLPSSIITISGSSFSRCTSLTSISIPTGVISLYDYTFFGCSKLSKVELHNNITYLGASAFEGCSKLTTLTIPDKVLTIDHDAFAFCTELTSISIPNSVKELEDNIFWGCSSLKTVNLGASIASLGGHPFTHCSSLTEIIVDKDNLTYASKNGILFNKNMTELIIYPIGLTGQYIMPNTVTTVKEMAFADCSNLTSIIMSENLNWILDDAFLGCSKLTSVNLPDSLYHLGYDSFGECTSLASITIPSSVYSIGNCSFEGCKNLIAIHVKSPTPCTFDNSYPDVFKGLSTNICVLYVPRGSKIAYQNAPQWWYFKNIIEETTNLKTVTSSELNIYRQNDMFFFGNLMLGILIQIYTQDGKLVFQENIKKQNFAVQLSKNKLYVIKVGEKCTKIIL